MKIGTEKLDLDSLSQIIYSDRPLELDESSKEAIRHCRNYLEKKISEEGGLYYGINTGFGSLCNIAISKEQIEKLQENLVLSHAAGAGDVLPYEICKIILALKIKSFCHGKSGVSLEMVDFLVECFNKDIIPVMYEMGSLGASGDLAPLAHLSLILLGKGEVYFNQIIMSCEEAFSEAGLNPIKLKSKEGLALINGTQFTTGIASWLQLEGMEVLQKASLCAAISLEAFNCNLSPFDPLIQQDRGHEGQAVIAQQVLSILDGSDLVERKPESVQDPYSFRCVPQVHGASFEIMVNAEFAVETEINSVTDNPLIFPDEDRIISGGNFHGQPLAIHLDAVAIALAEIGSISERRSFQLLNGYRGLPNFLTPNPGLHSGLMISQYTAASLVSQNKQYCTPASADSITSSAGQEDHVSMSANAATKALKVLENVKHVLAIEMLIALQALDFRTDRQIAPQIQAVKDAFRTAVPFMNEDRLLKSDLDIVRSFFDSLEIT